MFQLAVIIGKNVAISELAQNGSAEKMVSFEDASTFVGTASNPIISPVLVMLYEMKTQYLVVAWLN